MAQGSLLVTVYRQRELSPVPSAQITVTSVDTGFTKELVADENGHVRLLSLPAPQKQADRAQQDMQPLSYPLYTVFTRADGYIPVRVEGIQIFPGIESMLAVHMTPLIKSAAQETDTPRTDDFYGMDISQEIVIWLPPNAVSEDEPRMPKGPPADTDLFYYSVPQQKVPVAIIGEQDAIPVFEQEHAHNSVYIPDTITVHLGPAGEPARDVQVSFLDYIKNVASSEMSPIWPENALRANIHALVGFTLNRLCTQWYRSQGYPFDITNDLTLDQAFVEGRDIFENISLLADEIFYVYPRKRGKSIPLFTPYCTDAACAGLFSKRDTVKLSENGYTPLQILQSCYGGDVELIEAQQICGSFALYPGYPLQRESRGEPVRIIQRQLIRIRCNFPYIPDIISATGVFDASTQAAIRAFQELFGLDVDGTAGPATWYECSRVYTAVTGLRAPRMSYAGYVLQQGSCGEDVLKLQRYLNDLSGVYADMPSLRQDGIFGSYTTLAVIAFQRKFGLVCDGVAGPDTKDMLMLVWNNANSGKAF